VSRQLQSTLPQYNEDTSTKEATPHCTIWPPLALGSSLPSHGLHVNQPAIAVIGSSVLLHRAGSGQLPSATANLKTGPEREELARSRGGFLSTSPKSICAPAQMPDDLILVQMGKAITWLSALRAELGLLHRAEFFFDQCCRAANWQAVGLSLLSLGFCCWSTIQICKSKFRDNNRRLMIGVCDPRGMAYCL